MIVKLAWRNIWRNRKRSLITISSILFAVFFAVAMRSLQLGTYAWMIDSIVNSYTGYLEVHARGYSDDRTLDNSLVIDSLPQKITASSKHITGVSPRMESFALVATESKTKGAMVIGLVPEEDAEMLKLHDRLSEGELIGTNDDRILISKGLSKSLNVHAGDTLVMLGQGYQGTSAAGKYAIAGVIEFPSPTLNLMVIMPLPLAQEFLSTYDMASTLVVKITSGDDMTRVKKILEQELDPAKYEVKDWKEMLPELNQAIEADNAGGLIMILILYVVITFGIFGTMLMMLNERVYEFGVLISIGFNRWKLIATTLLESVMLTMIGVLAGIVVSRPLVLYYHYHPVRLEGDMAKAMENYGWEPVMASSIDWGIPLTHALVILVIALIVNLYSIFYILHLNPVGAMRK